MIGEFQSMVWGGIISLVHMLVTPIALRCCKTIAPVFIHAVSAFFCLLALVFISFFVHLHFWLAFSVLSFCVSSYLFIYGAIYKSLTLKILCAMRSSPTTDSLTTFVTLPTFTDRITLLEKMGHVSSLDGKYNITEKGKKNAAFFSVLRKFFNINSKAIYGNSILEK